MTRNGVGETFRVCSLYNRLMYTCNLLVVSHKYVSTDLKSIFYSSEKKSCNASEESKTMRLWWSLSTGHYCYFCLGAVTFLTHTEQTFAVVLQPLPLVTVAMATLSSPPLDHLWHASPVVNLFKIASLINCVAVCTIYFLSFFKMFPIITTCLYFEYCFCDLIYKGTLFIYVHVCGDTAKTICNLLL